MTLIVAATAATGFLASASLLALGMKLIWFRYVLATSIAYVGFLGFVWMWLRWSEGDADMDVGDVRDWCDLAPRESHAQAGPDLDTSSTFDLDGEGWLVGVALVAALVALAVSAGYMVFTAPAFLAEVLLDGTLSYGLYRRVRDLDRRHWLASAIERSMIPFGAVVACVVIAGLAMNAYVPTADSIGDVLTRLAGR